MTKKKQTVREQVPAPDASAPSRLIWLMIPKVQTVAPGQTITWMTKCGTYLVTRYQKEEEPKARFTAFVKESDGSFWFLETDRKGTGSPKHHATLEEALLSVEKHFKERAKVQEITTNRQVLLTFAGELCN